MYNVAKVTPSEAQQPDYFSGEEMPEAFAPSGNQISGLFELESGELVSIWQKMRSDFLGGLPLLLIEGAWPDTDGIEPKTVTGNFEEHSRNGLLASESLSTPENGAAIGWYSALSPYNDGTDRWLVSWSDCLLDRGGVNAFCQAGESDLSSAVPRYGLWVVDLSDGTRLPLIDARPGVIYTDVAVGYLKSVSESEPDDVEASEME